MLVRHLVPPRLESDNILHQKLCHRPARNGVPRIEVIKRDTQIIGYNYGHSGAGWTFGPGSAYHLVNQLEIADAPKNDAVTVIGSGIIGLLTAYELVQHSYTNISIVSAQQEDTTSATAAGLVMPSKVSTKPEHQFLKQCFEYSYEWYRQIIHQEHPHFTEGARLVSSYYGQRQPSFEPYIGKLMAEPQEVVIDFGNSKTIRSTVYDDVIFVEVYTLLKELRRYLAANGVKFITETVQALDDISAPILIVCAGLGSKNLIQDPLVKPIQGHLFMLQNQDPRIGEYTISFEGDQSVTHDGFQIKRPLYYHPKRAPHAPASVVGMLGTTYVIGANESTPHTEEFEKLLERSRAFFGV